MTRFKVLFPWIRIVWRFRVPKLIKIPSEVRVGLKLSINCYFLNSITEIWMANLGLNCSFIPRPTSIYLGNIWRRRSLNLGQIIIGTLQFKDGTNRLMFHTSGPTDKNMNRLYTIFCLKNTSKKSFSQSNHYMFFCTWNVPLIILRNEPFVLINLFIIQIIELNHSLKTSISILNLVWIYKYKYNYTC